MSMKKKQTISGAVLAVGVIITALGIYFRAGGNAVMYAGLIVILAGLVVQDRLFRCPKCGKRIWAGDYVVGNNCPKCDYKLGEEEEKK